MPNERLNALKRTRQFLMDLINPKKTPRIPKEVRREASARLRHYPCDYYLEELAEKSPEILSKD
jgi:hypothetical protein